MGDIPVKGIQQPNLTNVRCIENEKSEPAECELFRTERNSPYLFISILRLKNYLFLATTREELPSVPKCKYLAKEPEKLDQKGIKIEAGKKSEDKNIVAKFEESKRTTDCSGHGTTTDIFGRECECNAGYGGNVCERCKNGSFSVSWVRADACHMNVILNVTGATADLMPLFYSMDNITSSSPVFFNVPPGNHTFAAFGTTISGEICNFGTTGAIDVQTVDVVVPSPPPLSPTTMSQPTCTGTYFTVHVGNSTNSNFTYSLDGVNFTPNATLGPALTQLNQYYIMDSSGCALSYAVSLTNFYTPMHISYDVDYASCFTYLLGYATIRLNVTGGTPPYLYAVSGWPIYQTSNTYQQLVFGNSYTANVKDSSQCVATVRIDLMPTMQVTAKVGTICQSGNSVSVIFDVAGGSPPYNFRINGGTSNSSNIYYLPSMGISSFTVTDSNNCATSGTVNTSIPEAPIISSVSSVPTNGGPLEILGKWSNIPGVNVSFPEFPDAVWVAAPGFINATLPEGTGGNHLGTVRYYQNFTCISTNFSWSYFPPKISQTHGFAVHGGPLFLQGSNFGNGTISPIVIINQTQCKNCHASAHTNITCEFCPGGQLGPFYVLEVSVDGLSSVPIRFFYQDVPSAPNITNIQTGPTWITIFWISDPSATEYYLEILSHNTDQTFTDRLPPDYFKNISGLPTDTQYTIYLRTSNDAGNSPFTIRQVTIKISNVTVLLIPYCGDQKCDGLIGETCATCPYDCQICNITEVYFPGISDILSSTTVVIFWIPPANASSTYFYVTQFSDTPYVEDFETTGITQFNSYTVGNLTSNTTYYFRVAAQVMKGSNIFGTGPFSPIGNHTTSGRAAPPELVLRQHGRDYLTLSWQTPSYTGQLQIIYYIIRMLTPDNSTMINATSQTLYTQTFYGLHTNTNYSFSAQTVNSGWFSEPSFFTFATDPETCGDSHCAPEENCTSCFFDCGSCSYPTCKGTPECSRKGKCVQGVCECSGSWSGPDCSVDGTLPINIGGGNSSEVIITPSLPSQVANVTFNVAMKTIQELDVYGNIIHSFQLDDYPANKTVENFTLPDNSLTTKTTYNVSFPNSALLQISLVAFAKASVYPFAGRNISVPDNSVKYSIAVQNWPFLNIRNRLQIVIQTDGLSSNLNPCKNTETSTDGSQNVQWFKLDVDGVSLYATFVEETVADGRPGKASFELNQSDILLSVPSFWTQTEIDPVYSVLVDPNANSDHGCAQFSSFHKNSKTSKKIIGAVVGAVLGLALLTAIAYLGYKRYNKEQNRQYLANIYSSDSQTSLNGNGTGEQEPTQNEPKKKKRKKQAAENGNGTEMDSMHIEKVDGMEVNTAAGRFAVHY
eukprot:Phypoly_transcript_00587.p1 GENE.Phypoly_transcript_00587~~Phypoly_transcript_00587.p1  ORF type:complete len:1459 (+),score=169.69 Phypoly_transcript_00587:333-4379(+)